MQGDRASARPRSEGGPLGQPEVGVDDVEPLGAVAGAQRPRRAEVVTGCKREHLDVGLTGAPERRDLVGDEAAQRRPLGGREHVGDDQGAHRWRRI